MSEERDSEFTASARRVLEAGVRELDAGTQSRLQAARRRALEGAQRRPARLGWGLPAGALAMAAVVGLALVLLQRGPNETALVASLDDVELLSAAEPFEMWEDLDFYQWLEAEERGAG